MLACSALNSTLNSTVDIVELDALLDVVEVLLKSVPAGVEITEVIVERKPVKPGVLTSVVPVSGVLVWSADWVVTASEVPVCSGTVTRPVKLDDGVGDGGSKESRMPSLLVVPGANAPVEAGRSNTVPGPFSGVETPAPGTTVFNSDVPWGEPLEETPRSDCSVIRLPDDPETPILLAVLSFVATRPGIVPNCGTVPSMPGAPSAVVVLVPGVTVISIVVT